VKLIDFGLASSAMKLEHTATGTVLGKLSYMSPEQARGDNVDGSCDQFAAAVMAYELLVGERFYGGMPQHVIWQMVGQGGYLPDRWSEVPPELQTILGKALSADKVDRYKTCGDFREAIGAYLSKHHPNTSERTIRELIQSWFAADRDKERAFVLRFASIKRAQVREATKDSQSSAKSLISGPNLPSRSQPSAPGPRTSGTSGPSKPSPPAAEPPASASQQFFKSPPQSNPSNKSAASRSQVKAKAPPPEPSQPSSRAPVVRDGAEEASRGTGTSQKRTGSIAVGRDDLEGATYTDDDGIYLPAQKPKVNLTVILSAGIIGLAVVVAAVVLSPGSSQQEPVSSTPPAAVNPAPVEPAQTPPVQPIDAAPAPAPVVDKPEKGKPAGRPKPKPVVKEKEEPKAAVPALADVGPEERKALGNIRWLGESGCASSCVKRVRSQYVDNEAVIKLEGFRESVQICVDDCKAAPTP
jgi:serine/threonine-protein kinase